MSSHSKAPDPRHKHFGDTIVTILGDTAPALPHERDTSSHSQHGEPSPEVKQAYEDVKRGVVDADVGAPMDALYQHEFRKPHTEAPANKLKRDKKKPRVAAGSR